jgi:hypothetical protein
VYFISYPKCGTTWTRLRLGKYVQLLTNAETLPLFDGAAYEAKVAAAAIPRIVFTHAPLVWDTQTAADLTVENTVAPFASAKVVLITRYPLDALVSCQAQWRHQVTSEVPEPLEFIHHPVLGLEKLLAFHALWIAGRSKVRGFHLLRYESMLQATAEETRRLLAFLGIPVQEDVLAEAVRFSSFSSLQKLQLSEDVPVYPTSGFKVFGSVDSKNPASFHVRRGVTGGYRDDLPAAERAPLEARIAREMDPIFGYQQPPALLRARTGDEA